MSISKNGVSSAATANSTSLPNNNFLICSDNNTNSQRQLSMAYIGSSNFDQLSFYNIFQRFAVRQTFGLHGDLLTWYNALSVKPSSALMYKLDTLVWGLYYDGVWNELDLFHVMGGLETDEQRLRPIKNTNTTATTFTSVNSVTLSTSGVTGNGVDSYLNTNWNPSINGVKFTQLNSSIGLYCRSSSADTGTDFGASNGIAPTQLAIKRVAGPNYIFTIGNTTTVINSNINGADGFYSVSLSGGSYTILRNASASGLTANTGAYTAVGLETLNFYLCGRNTGSATVANPTVHNYAMLYCGSGNINQTTLYTRIQTYMTSVNLQV